MEVPLDGSLHQILLFVFTHGTFGVRRFFHIQFPPLEDHTALFQQAHGTLFGGEVHETPHRFIAVNEGDEPPL